MSYQQWIGLGNLTDDPEMKYVKETPKTTFSIAINERRGSSEETLFVDVECWEKLAETVAEYMRKGRSVLVAGRWKMDEWKDDNGNRRRKWYVRADQVRFVGNRDDDQPRRRSRDEDNERPRRERFRDKGDEDLPF